MKVEELDDALLDFRKEFKLDPDRRDALFQIVRLLCSMKRFDDAREGEEITLKQFSARTFEFNKFFNVVHSQISLFRTKLKFMNNVPQSLVGQSRLQNFENKIWGAALENVENEIFRKIILLRIPCMGGKKQLKIWKEICETRR